MTDCSFFSIMMLIVLVVALCIGYVMRKGQDSIDSYVAATNLYESCVGLKKMEIVIDDKLLERITVSCQE